MKKRTYKLGAAVLMGVVLCVATADADSIIVGGAFPGSAEVIAATPDVAGFGDDANVSLAQTFSVASAFSAQAIYLEYENDTNQNIDWTMTVSIFEVADVQATNLLAAGADLYTGTFTFPATSPAGGDTIARIDLDTPLALAASVGSTGYAIQIKESTGADFNPGWEWLRTTAGSGGNVYAGGQGYEDGDYQVDRDFALAISSIPEPGTLGLLGLAGMSIFVVRRLRSKSC